MTTLDTYLPRAAADLTTVIGTTPMVGVQTYVGLPAGGVNLLRTWYATAIDWCNIKLSKHDFVDDAGASTAPPDACVTAVYEFVRVMKDYHVRSTGIKKTKTGAREEEYIVNGMNANVAAAAAAWVYLELVMPDVTLFASGRG